MLTYEVNIDRIVVSNKVPFGKKVFKYFVSKKMILKKYTILYYASKNSALRKYFDETNVFLIKDNQLLKKINVIRNKVSKAIKKGFDSEPA